SIPLHAADPHVKIGQSCTAEFIEQIDDDLAVAEGEEEGAHRSDIQKIGPPPYQVAGDALQFHDDHAQIFRTLRNLQLHELLYSGDQHVIVRHSRQIVHPIRVGNDLRITEILRELLRSSM